MEFIKEKRRYKIKHENKSDIEIEFYKTYQKYPTEKELAQFLPFYKYKNKNYE